VLSAHTPKKSASAPSSGVRRTTPQPSGTPTSASTTSVPIATCMPLIDSGAEAASSQSRPSARRRTAGGIASGRATPYTPRLVSITFMVSERMRRSSQSERLWMYARSYLSFVAAEVSYSPLTCAYPVSPGRTR